MVYEPMKLKIPETTWLHYSDVIMGMVASQITSLTIVYSTVYSGADQRKHQSSASLAFVRGIHRGPVNSLHKWPVTRKMFPFNDNIMSLGHDDLKPMWPSDAIWQHRPGLTLTQSLPEPMSAYHWWGPVTITRGGFHKRYLNHQIQILAWTLLIVRRAGLLWSQQDFEWRWSVPLFKCLTVLEFSFILFDLCLLITFFNFIMNYVPIVTFWIFTYHKIWILSIMFCFICSYWIINFLACLEVSWRVVS